MGRFTGFLFSKLQLIYTRSEGAAYFLQLFDYTEIPINKNAMPWQEDEQLQALLGKKITIEGTMEAGRIYYEFVEEYDPFLAVNEDNEEDMEKMLELSLLTESDTLIVDGLAEQPFFNMTLQVNFPYRSIWKGVSPSSQLYEFIVQKEDDEIWRWSDGKVFTTALTPVSIPGGSPHSFKETWQIDPGLITEEGCYTIRAIFIASGQEVEKEINVEIIKG
jgi:hypothetical protein